MISAYEGSWSTKWQRRPFCIVAALLVFVLFAGLRLRGLPPSFYKDILDNASNSTLGFQKIFVVNLPSRSDHRDAVSLAAALTGLDIEYVPGVTDVDRKYLPPGAAERNLKPGALGCWRAHINILRTILEQNITSALIMEDDADWDIRIKSQMRDFARASQMLIQPVMGKPDESLDPSYPTPSLDQKPEDFEIGQHLVTPATSSPYGDVHRWDFLWLGHCGGRFPRASDTNVPIGRVMISNDETVAEPQHIDMEFGSNELVDEYPPHTRVVSRQWDNVCTYAYAVSQRGAAFMLHEAGVKRMDDPIDIMYQEICNGNGRPTGTCVTVHPQLFHSHRPVGSKEIQSDIDDHGKEYRGVAFTRNIRWSTRLNFENLIDGTEEYVDLFPDGEEADQTLGAV